MWCTGTRGRRCVDATARAFSTPTCVRKRCRHVGLRMAIDARPGQCTYTLRVATRYNLLLAFVCS